MNTLQSEWETFERQVMPANASTTQREDMRRAFYAGALVMVSLLAHADATMSKAAMEAMIDGWHSELCMFSRMVQAGEA